MIVLVYAVLSGEKPIFILILGLIGFFGVVGLGIYYKKIETDIEKKLDDLEKEKKRVSDTLLMINFFFVIASAAWQSRSCSLSRH